MSHGKIIIKCPYLENIVKENLKNQQMPYTDEAIRKLESIDIYVNSYFYGEDINIKTLEGIQHLKKLKFLDLTFSGVKDISLVSNLKNLRVLRLANNFIKDLSTLSALEKLEELDLETNLVEDITVLGKMQTLRNLTLTLNNISDIRPLAKLRNLEHLRCGENYLIKDIFLERDNLTKVKYSDIFLDLEGSDIFPNKHMKAIQRFRNNPTKSNAITALRATPYASIFTKDVLSDDEVMSFFKYKLSQTKISKEYITSLCLQGLLGNGFEDEIMEYASINTRKVFMEMSLKGEVAN